jgi:hypothetical protein
MLTAAEHLRSQGALVRWILAARVEEGRLRTLSEKSEAEIPAEPTESA